MSTLFASFPATEQRAAPGSVGSLGGRAGRNPALRALATLAAIATVTGVLCLVPGGAARALDLSAISNADAALAVKTALERSASAAVASLGTTDGFLGNPKVRIPPPAGLQRIERTMRMMGRQKQFDDLVTSINRAAEDAVAKAKPLLVDAVRSMTVADAKGIVSGPEDSVTRFFRERTEKALSAQFLPIVKQATDQSGLARQYNTLAGQAATFGVVDENEARIEDYVTARALDGLYLMIAEQERAICKDPVGTGSAILRRVFGAS